MDKHNYLFLDIETIPCQAPGLRSILSESLHCPNNIKKEETRKKWWRDKAPVLLNEAHLKTALDGSFGEIISIAWAFNDSPVTGLIRKMNESEKDLLQCFYNAIEESSKDYLVFCGHNILKFDIPFLRKRSIINNILPTVDLPSRRGSAVFDTMEFWAGYNCYIKLATLCQVLSIKGKGDIDGSMVYEMVQKDQYEEILAYNKQDVSCVRSCFNRMTFRNLEPAQEEKSQDKETELLEATGFFDE